MTAPTHADFDLPEMQTCPACQCAVPSVIALIESGVHYARLSCGGCGRWIRFLPKPDAERKNRPASARKVAKRFSAGYCEMCLRQEDELPPGQTIEGHHKIPHRLEEAQSFGFDEAGDDSRENVWILCTGCHKLVDWTRTYVGAHYRKMLAVVRATGTNGGRG